MVLGLIVFIFVHIFIFFIRCEDADNSNAGEIIFIDTTTEQKPLKIEVAEEDVEKAMYLDYGRYSTQAFAYANSQFDSPLGPDVVPCFDSHIRCLVTVVVPQTVCAVNEADDYDEGLRDFDTYCDAYLDNCLRRMRFWRIIDYGKCMHYWGKEDFEVLPVRRQNSQKFKNMITLLTGKEIRI